MTEKKLAGKNAASKPADPNTFKVTDGVNGFKKDMSTSQLMAIAATDTYLCATTLKQFSGGGEKLGITELIGEMQTAANEVCGGNLARVEKMLVNQALTLDAIFNNMAQKSGTTEYLKSMEVYMRLALKAQAQARSTAEALALLKNPQPYIRQANITAGHQQINNQFSGGAGAGAVPSDHSVQSEQVSTRIRTENLQTEPNKLLEADHGQRLDIRAADAAGRADQAMETVGAVNRAKVVSRQAAGR
jgi:hypothetical protein